MTSPWVQVPDANGIVDMLGVGPSILISIALLMAAFVLALRPLKKRKQ